MVDIPNDILLLIFKTCVHTLKLSPVRLLLVNRRWYTLAWSTPSLWTRVYIHIDSRDVIPHIVGTSVANCENGKPPQLGSLRFYLDRSCAHDSTAQLPLDIIIIWNTRGSKMQDVWHIQTEVLLLALSGVYLKGYEEGYSNLRVGFQDILPHISHYHDQVVASFVQTDSLVTFPRNDAHRWKSLTIDLFDSGYVCSVRFPSNCRLGMLESLTLGCTGLDLSCGVVMPSLREIDLDNSTIFPDPDTLDIDTVKCLRLRIRPFGVHGDFFIPRINLKGLSTLEVLGGNGITYGNSDLFQHLAPIFNKSNKLSVLTVAPLDFSSLDKEFARWSSNLRIEKLKLSSENLSTKLTSETGASGGSFMAIRLLMELQLSGLLVQMRRLGTIVEAMDPTMENILQRVKSNWE